MKRVKLEHQVYWEDAWSDSDEEMSTDGILGASCIYCGEFSCPTCDVFDTNGVRSKTRYGKLEVQNKKTTTTTIKCQNIWPIYSLRLFTLEWQKLQIFHSIQIKELSDMIASYLMPPDDYRKFIVNYLELLAPPVKEEEEEDDYPVEWGETPREPPA